ncbi:hypothetical protein GGI07_000214 [Coemansia sp. Benny D115]|nr:hypothetical protein GGI07_000214 [Coemansia sp. Benny D115]
MPGHSDDDKPNTPQMPVAEIPIHVVLETEPPVRAKFAGSPRSSSASSAGDGRSRRPRIESIVSEPMPLRSPVSAGPRLPPISTLGHPLLGKERSSGMHMSAVSASLSPPFGASRLPRIRTPPVRSATPSEQLTGHSGLSRRSHPYLSASHHHHHGHSHGGPTASLRGSLTPGTAATSSSSVMVADVRSSPSSTESSAADGSMRVDSLRAASLSASSQIQIQIQSPAARLRGLLADGRTAYGIQLDIPSAGTARLAARLGYDWALIDTAHPAATVTAMVGALSESSSNCVSLVRVPMGSSEWIRWAVTAGAQGIVVPGIKDAQQMRQVVSLCRDVSADILVVPQMDGIPDAAEDNVEGVLGVPGVDAALVRAESGSLGLAPPQHRALGLLGGEATAASAHLMRAAGRFSVPLGVLEPAEGAAGAARVRRQQGFQLVAVGSDLDVLATAAADRLRMARAG